jgi:hypothetical protein
VGVNQRIKIRVMQINLSTDLILLAVTGNAFTDIAYIISFVGNNQAALGRNDLEIDMVTAVGKQRGN